MEFVSAHEEILVLSGKSLKKAEVLDYLQKKIKLFQHWNQLDKVFVLAELRDELMMKKEEQHEEYQIDQENTQSKTKEKNAS